MAIIDVVKYEQQDGVLAHRYSSSELRWGTQLVVYPGQEAVFVKGGAVCDKFTAGTYTLKSNNIPLLYKVAALPFGGDSPFQADVWFLSLLDRLDLKWGTETPIQIEDPKFGIIVPMRAYGQWGFRISDSSKFLNRLLGNLEKFEDNKLQSYFRGILLSNLTSIITEKIISDRISLFNINHYLTDISSHCQRVLNVPVADYGIEIIAFNIISINIPEGDPSVAELKKAVNLKAQFDVAGEKGYKLRRIFDVLEASAENESGNNNFMNMGIGLAAGVGMGGEVNRLFKEAINDKGNVTAQNPTEAASSAADYYMAINGEQHGPFTQEEFIKLSATHRNAPDTLVWKPGMEQWVPLSKFRLTPPPTVTPPPIPKS